MRVCLILAHIKGYVCYGYRRLNTDKSVYARFESAVAAIKIKSRSFFLYARRAYGYLNVFMNILFIPELSECHNSVHMACLCTLLTLTYVVKYMMFT